MVVTLPKKNISKFIRNVDENKQAKNKRLWVFRLSTGDSGEPANYCPVGVDEQEIKRYRQEVSPIDDDSYLALDIDVLIDEFKRGKLRQGWGMSFEGMNLNLDQPLERWVKRFIKLYWRIWGEKVNCPIAMGRYNILKRMTDMEVGDIIFVPRIPEENKFTVATVKKKYYFQRLNGFIGYRHVIEVKKIKEFSYGSRILPKSFNPYRRAVGEIKEEHQNFRAFKNFIEKHYL